MGLVGADLYRYHRAVGVVGFLTRYCQKPGFRYVFWMRVTWYLSEKPALRLLYWVASFQRRRLEIKYGISIPPETQIGPG